MEVQSGGKPISGSPFKINVGDGEVRSAVLKILGVLSHNSALQGYTGPRTTWANEMNFVRCRNEPTCELCALYLGLGSFKTFISNFLACIVPSSKHSLEVQKLCLTRFIP